MWELCHELLFTSLEARDAVIRLDRRRHLRSCALIFGGTPKAKAGLGWAAAASDVTQIA